MGRWLANVILLLVIVMVFSAVAMADYFLRSEETGKTRRALAADGVELNMLSVMRAAAGNDVVVLSSLAELGTKLGLKWDWGVLEKVPADILEEQVVDAAGVWSGEMTPLMVAVAAGSDEAVDFLLALEVGKKSLEVRRVGDGLSVLDLALQTRKYDLARKLMVAGAKELDGEQGQSYLLRAVKGDDVALFDFLMERKVGGAGADAGEQALRWAVRENELGWVRRLGSADLDLDLKVVGVNIGEDGESLLTGTYKAGRDEMLALLLELGVGAGLHARNTAGESLLTLALAEALHESEGEVEKTRGREWLLLWLRAGATLEFAEEGAKAGRSLVDDLIESGDSELLGLMVKSMGGQVPDTWMLKAFDLGLVAEGDDEVDRLRVLRLLFRLGGDVEAGRDEDEAGGRLLRRAVVAGDGDLVRWLLESGADAEGELWRVLGNGDAQMLKMLLQHGADANEPLAIGVGSPLSLCLRKRRYDLARLLLDHGAEVDPGGSEGLSLLEQVVSRGDIRAATLLREYDKQ